MAGVISRFCIFSFKNDTAVTEPLFKRCNLFLRCTEARPGRTESDRAVSRKSARRNQIFINDLGKIFFIEKLFQNIITQGIIYFRGIRVFFIHRKLGNVNPVLGNGVIQIIFRTALPLLPLLVDLIGGIDVAVGKNIIFAESPDNISEIILLLLAEIFKNPSACCR